MGNEFLFPFGVVTVFIEKSIKKKRILKRILKTTRGTLTKKFEEY